MNDEKKEPSEIGLCLDWLWRFHFCSSQVSGSFRDTSVKVSLKRRNERKY